ncbi:type II secretion system F family protein [Thermogutta sp.]|uniref:type II secretion system F family protein n=1 Tax=Thermogutta sp. TaxID=1962930 RepID=UPI003C7AF760
MNPGASIGGSPVDWETLADVISQTVRSDLPLPNALEALAEDCPDRATKSVFRKLAGFISQGLSLQDGLRRLSDAQSRELRGILEASALCPHPGVALARLLQLKRHYQELLRDLRATVGYPTLCGLVILAGSLIVVSQWLMSGFSPINFTDFSDIGSISSPTYCSTSSSSDLLIPITVWWLASFLLLFVVVVATIVLVAVLLAPVQLSAGNWVYRVPLLGKYYKAAALSYLAGVMAELLSQQVQMPAALTAGARVSRWPDLKEALQEASFRAEEGISLGEAMAKNPWMSASFLAFLTESPQSIPIEERLAALYSLFDGQSRCLGVALERKLTFVMLLGLIPALMPLLAWFAAVQSYLAAFSG